MVPPLDGRRRWPTLGPELWEWMLDRLVYGPGDLRGVRLRDHPPDEEFRALLYRAYEVHPRSGKVAGRRRFKRVALSMRKGTAKTEKAAWIAAAELHPEAPVRCDGWRKEGRRWEPVGVGVRDPYIPMVAYTEEQTEELAYQALLTVIAEGPLADDFDIGLARIMRPDGAGKAEALATAPDARDGARTTFQHFDETHRLVLPRHRETHQTMLANVPKRWMADAWSLETTTTFTPGEGSVAEGTMDYARAIDAGKVRDPRLFFFHRQAGDHHDLATEDGVREAIVEASGPAAEWSDIDTIVSLWADPTTDRAYFERVWLNRPVKAADQMFDMPVVDGLARKGVVVADGAVITLGFDGSRSRDATALIATDVLTGFQWPMGIWERPAKAREWEVPARDVMDAVDLAFDRWEVWRAYCDPPYWETLIDELAARHGDTKIVRWYTDRPKPMAHALRGYRNAIAAGEVTHDGDPRFLAHLGNARRRPLNIRDDQGEPLDAVRKERKDSLHFIDAAVAGCLSWEARGDALAAGAVRKRRSRIPVSL